MIRRSPTGGPTLSHALAPLRVVKTLGIDTSGTYPRRLLAKTHKYCDCSLPGRLDCSLLPDHSFQPVFFRSGSLVPLVTGGRLPVVDLATHGLPASQLDRRRRHRRKPKLLARVGYSGRTPRFPVGMRDRNVASASIAFLVSARQFTV
jgi:hypothetical protein